MAQRQATFTTRSAPIGALALLMAVPLGVTGAGLWASYWRDRVGWREPFTDWIAWWERLILAPFEGVTAWAPQFLELMFGYDDARTVYFYLGEGVLFAIGLFVMLTPDAIAHLKRSAGDNIEDEEQERIVEAFVGERANRRKRIQLPPLGEFAEVGKMLLGIILVAPLIWPPFLIAVPFAILSAVTRGPLTTHFQRASFIIFSPVFIFLAAWALNYALAWAAGAGLMPSLART